MTRALTVLVVGYGYASATFHAPLVHAVPGLRLAGVVSRQPAQVQADWPGLPVFADLDAALHTQPFDLVVIATPNATHYPLAQQALAHGCHVVVDKPFTLTVAEADALMAQAADAGRHLSVFHNRRWDSDFLQVQSVMAQGRLGDWTHCELHFDRYRPVVRPRWRESSDPGGGLWYDLGPHLLDQVLQLFGPPDSLWLDTAQQRAGAQSDDWFHAVLAYGQRRAIVHASALTARVAPRWLVHGTRGSYEKWGLDVQEDALKARQDPCAEDWGLDLRCGLLTVSEGDALRQETLSPARGDYKVYYRQLAQVVSGAAPDTSLPVTAEQARAVMRLIEQGLESRRTGRVLPLRPTTATSG